MRYMARVILITLDDTEDETVNKIVGILAEQGHFSEILNYSSNPVIAFPGLEIDASSRKVIFEGKEIVLTAMEFDVLLFLAKHQNQICSPEKIYTAVERESYMAGEYLIKNVIYQIRKKLSPDIIKTVRGCGYQFNMQNFTQEDIL